MTARFSLIPRRAGADFMRLGAIAHALRVMRLRATALALRRAPLQFSYTDNYALAGKTGWAGCK
jgi:hypothetical protein